MTNHADIVFNEIKFPIHLVQHYPPPLVLNLGLRSNLLVCEMMEKIQDTYDQEKI